MSKVLGDPEATPAASPPTRRERLAGRIAWVAAWAGLVLGQLHALARFRTADGQGDLASGLVRSWAEPADDLLSPLLGWAAPDVVYATYGKLWLPVFLAFTVAAFAVRRQRRPAGFERWAWRVALVGYVGACASVAAEYWTQWGRTTNGLLDVVFLASVPIILVTMLASTVLGVTLLVRGFRPRLPAVLLMLAVPGMVVVMAVTSLGNIVLPIAFAFGVLGRRLAAQPAVPDSPGSAGSPGSTASATRAATASPNSSWPA